MGIIYLITNKLNNKRYVGQTIRTLKKRWYEHCKTDDRCVALNSAIQKYSPENFECVKLCRASNEELDELETKYIKEYNSVCPNGYNIQTGGGKGRKHCPESRERMRKSKLGNKNPNFGKPRTDETKQKISEAKSGSKHHFYGKHLNYEHKLNLSKAHKKDNLPMYLTHCKARPMQSQSEGYCVTNHPNGKNKYFTSKTLSLEEKYQLALKYLNELNSL